MIFFSRPIREETLEGAGSERKLLPPSPSMMCSTLQSFSFHFQKLTASNEEQTFHTTLLCAIAITKNTMLDRGCERLNDAETEREYKQAGM
jgi:hypothetical protein